MDYFIRLMRKKFAGYLTAFAIGVAVGIYYRGPLPDDILGTNDRIVSPSPIIGTGSPARPDVLVSPTVSPPPGPLTEDVVTSVVDGDTIKLKSGATVRYIGIDTPETRHPTRGIECFGTEAAAYNRSLVEGKRVRLEKDVSETDRYGRLLRYVYVLPEASDGAVVEVNEHLIANGYAYASSYPPDVAHDTRLALAERTARERGLGLWTACPR
jgi:micrococcal nuclease